VSQISNSNILSIWNTYWYGKKSRLIRWITLSVGFSIYIMQSLYAIYTLRSPMDEGNYVLKGLYYASGQYVPYQPYGFIANKMPMSFLIPGWILQFFEPGIIATRIYAFVLSILFLIGLFLLIRRESNYFLALLSVWVFALNPVLIKTFAMAISQGLIACLLVWSFVLYFGKNRTLLQILAGSLLTGFVIMSRENMIPVLVFLWIYIFLRHRNRFWITFFFSLAPIIFFHILYFPNILTNWIKWIPFSGIRQILYNWLNIVMPKTIPTPESLPPLFSRLTAFFEGIKINLWIFLSYLLANALLFTKRIKERKFEILSLSVLFFILVSMHIWASIGKDYCIYCFQNYLSFFNFLGLLIFALAFFEWNGEPFKHPKWVVGGLSLLSFITITLSSYKEMYRSTIFLWLDQYFWKFPLPRIKDFRLAEGTMNIKAILINKFGWDLEVALKIIFPIFSVALVLIVIFLIGICLFKIWQKKLNIGSTGNSWNAFILFFLLLALIISPTFLGGNTLYSFQCQNNVLDSFTEAGKVLAKTIEPGSTIDWRSSDSPLLLLYLQNIKLHPPQLNNLYSFENSKDTDLLERMGMWNEELAEQWLLNSDYLIVSPRDINDDLALQLQQYYEMAVPTIFLYSCDGQTMNLRVYRRNK